MSYQTHSTYWTFYFKVLHILGPVQWTVCTGPIRVYDISADRDNKKAEVSNPRPLSDNRLGPSPLVITFNILTKKNIKNYKRMFIKTQKG